MNAVDVLDYEVQRRECREKLAGRLGWRKVPNDVWGHVDELGLVGDAIARRDNSAWQELEDEARAYRSQRPEGSADGRGSQGRKERAAAQEIEVELDDYTRLRSEIVAELAEEWPVVRKTDGEEWRKAAVRLFRSRYLGGRLLSDEEADEFLRGDGIGQRQLGRLVRKLVRAYRWPERQARRFVLTGRPPAPLYLSVAVGEGEPPLVPDKARIWIDAEAWVDAEEVARAYRAAQRQLLGGDNRKIPIHHLEAFRFVRRHTSAGGSRPSWPRLRELWNEEHPDHPYRQRNGLFQAFKYASERLLHPGYNRPRWKGRDTH